MAVIPCLQECVTDKKLHCQKTSVNEYELASLFKREHLKLLIRNFATASVEVVHARPSTPRSAQQYIKSQVLWHVTRCQTPACMLGGALHLLMTRWS
jgi:hypothetical protein